MAWKVNTTLVCVHVVSGNLTDVSEVPLPDIRSNKPFGIHDQSDNNTTFFQELIAARIGSRDISLAIPNEISLSLSVSKKSFLKADKKRRQLVEHAIQGETLFSSEVEIVYDFLEEIQKAVIFGYKAVESFCNACIPDEYSYSKKNSRGIVEQYGKEQIERWISTSEKVSEILPKILACASPSSQKFWGDFKKLESLRNEIIHSKSNNSASTLSDLFSDETGEYVKSSVLLLEYFIKLDPSNPIFPLGFGKSTVNVISVPDASKYLEIIEKESSKEKNHNPE